MTGEAHSSTSDEAFRREYHRLALLYQVSNVIHSTLEPHEALQLILAEAVRVMRASSGSVVLVNPTNGFLEIQASHGLPPNGAALKLRVGEGITGWVAKHGRPVRIGDVAADPRYIMVNDRVRSELAVPLDVNGEIRGVINVDSDRDDAFSADDEQLLRDLAMQASKVIHNTWLYEQLRLKAQLLESLLKVGQTINSTLNLGDALIEPRLFDRNTRHLGKGGKDPHFFVRKIPQFGGINAKRSHGSAMKNQGNTEQRNQSFTPCDVNTLVAPGYLDILHLDRLMTAHHRAEKAFRDTQTGLRNIGGAGAVRRS
jgi:hypothetical protein